MRNFSPSLTSSRRLSATRRRHTDSSGSDSLNETLSRKRADSVRTVLVSRGVREEQITVVGNGETKPIADNATKEGRAKNRRVEVHIDVPNPT